MLQKRVGLVDFTCSKGRLPIFSFSQKFSSSRVVAWVTTIPPQTDRAYTVAACSEPSLMQLVAVELVKAAVMVGCSLDAPTVLAARSMGTVEIKLLEQDGLLSPLPVTDDSWQAWLQGMHDSHTQLKAALLGIPDDHDCREELVEWADRVGLFPVDEIDSVVLGECQDFSDPVLVRTAFSHRVQPPVTSRLLPLCVQMPRPGFQPRCIVDILKPWAIALMDMWFEAMLLTMQDMIA